FGSVVCASATETAQETSKQIAGSHFIGRFPPGGDDTEKARLIPPHREPVCIEPARRTELTAATNSKLRPCRQLLEHHPQDVRSAQPFSTLLSWIPWYAWSPRWPVLAPHIPTSGRRGFVVRRWLVGHRC